MSRFAACALHLLLPVPLILVLAAPLPATPAFAATIVIESRDGPGEGLNDPSPVAPVGGNPATTLGAQRLLVLQYAASLWGAILPDRVLVRVDASFDPLSCSEFGAVLGVGGATYVMKDFHHAPFAGTWYPAALANRLAMEDLDPAAADIEVKFNSALGSLDCFLPGWYLGVDGNQGGAAELLPVALHELAHGLGFSTPTSRTTGAVMSGSPGVWDHFLLDEATGRHWVEETAAERVASVTSCNRLTWDGAAVTRRARDVLGATPLVRLSAPVAADYDAGAAEFGAALTRFGVTGDVVLVQDGFGNPTNGCESITTDLAGKIALIDRGTCAFTDKVMRAQEAGAIGVIIADTLPGCPPAGLGGFDPAITIPAVRIGIDDGSALRRLLTDGVTATLLADRSRPAGAAASGRMKLFAPYPRSSSAVVHWDTTARPDLLMEPFDSPALSANVDLTEQLFVDIGWCAGTGVEPDPGLTALEPCNPSPMRGTGIITFSVAREMPADVRVYDIAGREVVALASGPQAAGRHSIVWNCVDAAGRRLRSGVYFCRLRTPGYSESRTLVLAR